MYDDLSDPGFRRRALLATLPMAFAASGCEAAAPRRERDRRPVQGPPPGPVRQPGVAEPQQPHMLFVSYDLTPGTRGAPGRDAVRRLLARWSELLAGLAPGPTATVGIGPGLPERLGVGAPEGLRELPAFAGEHLDVAAGGGEIGVQICARDARGCERLAGLLAGAGAGVLRPRWRQAGFLSGERPGPRSELLAPPRAGEASRDLLGFKNGTSNPTAAENERWVWLPPGGRYADGTFLVVRRIRLRVEEFGRLPVARQEQIVGCRKGGGEVLSSDLNARTPEGSYVLPLDAHVRLAGPGPDGGARMLRRSYSYENSPGDRGMLFLAYMRDPALFVRVGTRLAASDALNSFAEQYGSALFYVLPGVGGSGRALGSTVL
ncbi:peroxidase [Streptomyces xanthochromogenes]|nr:peroxidase [Streptomyces xanthochromogenes]